MDTDPKKLVVMASGRGSNFQAILDHIRLDVLQNVEMVLLLANHADAAALERASSQGVEALLLERVMPAASATPEEKEQARRNYDARVLEQLKRRNVEMVALAGFDQILSSVLVDAYPMSILNIHPALDMGRFGGRGMVGRRVHEAVLASREKISGCTVHFVDNSVDQGPILLQHSVPVFRGDNPDTLSTRVLVAEHRTYSKAIQLLVDGRIVIHDGRVHADPYSGMWDYRWKLREVGYLKHQQEHSRELYGVDYELVQGVLWH